uniref:hypothetical protein n=1 Tax=Nonomuraea bangladeshensis TaxID=404385 RepID=UPI003F490EC7
MIVMIVLLALTGCSTAEDAAAARTRVEAERIGRVMVLVNSRRSADAFVRVAEAEQGPHDLRVRALEASGDKFEGGAVVVLQISVAGPFTGTIDTGKGRLVSATRCYRYTIEHETTDSEPEEIDCGRWPSPPPTGR